jgi:CPA1 family monovalent cation:H+ antiporter
MTLGGLGVGLAVGYAASFAHRYVDDHLVEITLSTIVAYGSFLLGQWLDMSGVVACVTAAVVLGNYGQHRTMAPLTRVTMSTVWEYAAFVANSLIFLLIGLRIDLTTVTDHVGLVLIGFGAVLAGRAVTVYGYGLASRLAGRRLPMPWQHVMFWGGLRGTIALALVLSVPDDLAGRETLQVLTFGVVLMSLVGQGLTMPPLARRLGLVDAEEAAARSRRRAALLEGFIAAHEELDRLQESGDLPRVEHRHLERTIEEQEAVLLEGLDPVSEEPPEGDDERLSARMGALLAQRRRITALRNAGVLATAAAEDLVDEIDVRLALLADRLACESGAECAEGGSPAAPGL